MLISGVLIDGHYTKARRQINIRTYFVRDTEPSPRLGIHGVELCSLTPRSGADVTATKEKRWVAYFSADVDSIQKSKYRFENKSPTCIRNRATFPSPASTRPGSHITLHSSRPARWPRSTYCTLRRNFSQRRTCFPHPSAESLVLLPRSPPFQLPFEYHSQVVLETCRGPRGLMVRKEKETTTDSLTRSK